MQRKHLWAISLAFLLILLLVLIAVVSYRREVEQPPLLVGMDPTYPPFGSRQPDGTLTGFDVELVESLAKSLNRKPEIKEIAYRDLLPALADGAVDIVVSAMPIRQDREAIARFSQPYYDATQVAVASNGGKEGWESLADLADCRLGAKIGTTGEFEALALKGGARADDLWLMGNVPDLFEALHEGTIDALLVDQQLALRYLELENVELRCYELDCWEEQYAVAVLGGQEELLGQVNRFLAAWLQSPSYEKALARWFGP